jgi:hypothetical protein
VPAADGFPFFCFPSGCCVIINLVNPKAFWGGRTGVAPPPYAFPSARALNRQWQRQNQKAFYNKPAINHKTIADSTKTRSLRRGDKTTKS